MKKYFEIAITKVGKKAKKDRELLVVAVNETQVEFIAHDIGELTDFEKSQILTAIQVLICELADIPVQSVPQMIQTGCECPKCKPRH
jgi:hypothetical protein